MESNLTSLKCVPCEGGIPPLNKAEAENLLVQIPGWEIVEEGKKITVRFSFKDFRQSMSFVNKVADLAESEGHHPSILIVWNKVTLTSWTYVIKGLSQNDFILAAKINEINGKY